MKRCLLLGCWFFSLASALAGFVFEPFADASGRGGTAYPVGGFLFGQANHQGNVWHALTNTPTPPATGLPRISAGNLTYPGLPASSGNHLFIPSATGVMGRLSLDFTTTTGAVYFSFLLKVTDVSALDTSGAQDNFFIGFGDTVGQQNATLLRAVTRVYSRRAAGGFNLGVARNSGAPSNWVFENTVRRLDEVLFVVGSQDYDQHTANLWVNPAPSTFGAAMPPAPTLTATRGADLNANGVRALVLGCRTNAPPACFVDELRVGSSWALVTGSLGIAAQPASQTLDAGLEARFTVVAAGAEPFNYEWRKNGVALTNSPRVLGVNGPQLTVRAVTQTDAGEYTVRISNALGAVTSAAATLAVRDPAITIPPRDLAMPAGATALFHAEGSGAAPLAWRWWKEGAPLADGGSISGAITPRLTISNLTANDAGKYSVSVTNAMGAGAVSPSAELLVTGPAPRPNIVFILTDDLGYGDLGVLFQNQRAPGLPRESTPHLDALAAGGLQLRRHYCGAPVCAPSRASLLLGQHQGHANVRDEQWDKALAKNHTLATVLRRAGYATAAIGKWGLAGDDLGGAAPADWPGYPTQRGFDYFMGYVRHGDGHEHYPKEALYANGSKECYDGTNNITPALDKCYTTDLFTARAKQWIRDQQAARPEQPFFLYLAYDTPHSVYELPTQAYPAGGGLAGGLQWLGQPGHMINTADGVVDSFFHPDYAAATYDDDGDPNTPRVRYPEVFQRYATSVRRIDDAVGDLQQLLRDLAIDTNTLVIFASDNGPTREDKLNLPVRYAADFFDTFGPLDGIKRDTWEGGIRVPLLARWPGVIPPGRISDSPSQFQDWLPTFAALAGLPAPASSDGVSLAPTLTGQGEQAPGTVYVEYEDTYSTPAYPEFEPAHRNRVHNQMQVIYLDGLKGVRYDIRSHADNFEIYDVLNDPKEAVNLALTQDLAELQQRMKDRVLQLRRPDPAAPRPYDEEFLPPVSPSPTIAGVEWQAYAAPLPWAAEMAGATPFAEGVADRPDATVRTEKENLALVFSGFLYAPADGDYTFHLSVDGGALLRIHDAIVADADFGYTPGAEISGATRLRAGWHPFRLAYVHRSAGTPSLSLDWGGPGFPRQAIPASAFRRSAKAKALRAMDDQASTPAAQPVTIDVLANDSGPVPFSISAIETPRAGQAIVVGARILYTPREGFLGEDVFGYAIGDGQSAARATVTVNVHLADRSYWFPFNETSGLTSPDAATSVAVSLLGFTNNPRQWVEGRWNRGLQFDGAANKAVINGYQGVTGAAPRTVSAWVKTTETAKSMGIASWGDLASGRKWSFLIQNTTEPKGSLRLEAGYGNIIGSSPVNDGQWHHVACVLERLTAPSSTNIQLFVDGRPDPVSGGAPTQIDTAAAGEVLIGCDIQNRYFNGVLDEVRLANRALTRAEIAAEFGASSQSAAAWHFRYFGSAIPEWSADDDLDGASRLAEYAFGGQPHLADPELRRVLAQLAGDHLHVIFTRRPSGTHELAYECQSSPDLLNWRSLPGEEIAVTTAPSLHGFEQVEFRANPPISSQATLFVRIAATPTR